jgi:hypothetical protein
MELQKLKIRMVFDMGQPLLWIRIRIRIRTGSLFIGVTGGHAGVDLLRQLFLQCGWVAFLLINEENLKVRS